MLRWRQLTAVATQARRALRCAIVTTVRTASCHTGDTAAPSLPAQAAPQSSSGRYSGRFRRPAKRAAVRDGTAPLQTSCTAAEPLDEPLPLLERETPRAGTGSPSRRASVPERGGRPALGDHPSTALRAATGPGDNAHAALPPVSVPPPPVLDATSGSPQRNAASAASYLLTLRRAAGAFSANTHLREARELTTISREFLATLQGKLPSVPADTQTSQGDAPPPAVAWTAALATEILLTMASVTGRPRRGNVSEQAVRFLRTTYAQRSGALHTGGSAREGTVAPPPSSTGADARGESAEPARDPSASAASFVAQLTADAKLAIAVHRILRSAAQRLTFASRVVLPGPRETSSRAHQLVLQLYETEVSSVMALERLYVEVLLPHLVDALPLLCLRHGGASLADTDNARAVAGGAGDEQQLSATQPPSYSPASSPSFTAFTAAEREAFSTVLTALNKALGARLARSLQTETSRAAGERVLCFDGPVQRAGQQLLSSVGERPLDVPRVACQRVPVDALVTGLSRFVASMGSAGAHALPCSRLGDLRKLYGEIALSADLTLDAPEAGSREADRPRPRQPPCAARASGGGGGQQADRGAAQQRVASQFSASPDAHPTTKRRMNFNVDQLLAVLQFYLHSSSFRLLASECDAGVRDRVGDAHAVASAAPRQTRRASPSCGGVSSPTPDPAAVMCARQLCQLIFLAVRWAPVMRSHQTSFVASLFARALAWTPSALSTDSGPAQRSSAASLVQPADRTGAGAVQPVDGTETLSSQCPQPLGFQLAVLADVRARLQDAFRFPQDTGRPAPEAVPPSGESMAVPGRRAPSRFRRSADHTARATPPDVRAPAARGVDASATNSVEEMFTMPGSAVFLALAHVGLRHSNKFTYADMAAYLPAMAAISSALSEHRDRALRAPPVAATSDLSQCTTDAAQRTRQTEEEPMASTAGTWRRVSAGNRVPHPVETTVEYVRALLVKTFASGACAKLSGMPRNAFRFFIASLTDAPPSSSGHSTDPARHPSRAAGDGGGDEVAVSVNATEEEEEEQHQQQHLGEPVPSGRSKETVPHASSTTDTPARRSISEAEEAVFVKGPAFLLKSLGVFSLQDVCTPEELIAALRALDELRLLGVPAAVPDAVQMFLRLPRVPQFLTDEQSQYFTLTCMQMIPRAAERPRSGDAEALVRQGRSTRPSTYALADARGKACATLCRGEWSPRTASWLFASARKQLRKQTSAAQLLTADDVSGYCDWLRSLRAEASEPASRSVTHGPQSTNAQGNLLFSTMGVLLQLTAHSLASPVVDLNLTLAVTRAVIADAGMRATVQRVTAEADIFSPAHKTTRSATRLSPHELLSFLGVVLPQYTVLGGMEAAHGGLADLMQRRSAQQAPLPLPERGDAREWRIDDASPAQSLGESMTLVRTLRAAYEEWLVCVLPTVCHANAEYAKDAAQCMLPTVLHTLMEVDDVLARVAASREGEADGGLVSTDRLRSIRKYVRELLFCCVAAAPTDNVTRVLFDRQRLAVAEVACAPPQSDRHANSCAPPALEQEAALTHSSSAALDAQASTMSTTTCASLLEHANISSVVFRGVAPVHVPASSRSTQADSTVVSAWACLPSLLQYWRGQTDNATAAAEEAAEASGSVSLADLCSTLDTLHVDVLETFAHDGAVTRRGDRLPGALLEIPATASPLPSLGSVLDGLLSASERAVTDPIHGSFASLSLLADAAGACVYADPALLAGDYTAVSQSLCGAVLSREDRVDLERCVVRLRMFLAQEGARVLLRRTDEGRSEGVGAAVVSVQSVDALRFIEALVVAEQYSVPVGQTEGVAPASTAGDERSTSALVRLLRLLHRAQGAGVGSGAREATELSHETETTGLGVALLPQSNGFPGCQNLRVCTNILRSLASLSERHQASPAGARVERERWLTVSSALELVLPAVLCSVGSAGLAKKQAKLRENEAEDAGQLFTECVGALAAFAPQKLFAIVSAFDGPSQQTANLSGSRPQGASRGGWHSRAAPARRTKHGRQWTGRNSQTSAADADSVNAVLRTLVILCSWKDNPYTVASDATEARATSTDSSPGRTPEAVEDDQPRRARAPRQRTAMSPGQRSENATTLDDGDDGSDAVLSNTHPHARETPSWELENNADTPEEGAYAFTRGSFYRAIRTVQATLKARLLGYAPRGINLLLCAAVLELAPTQEDPILCGRLLKAIRREFRFALRPARYNFVASPLPAESLPQWGSSDAGNSRPHSLYSYRATHRYPPADLKLNCIPLPRALAGQGQRLAPCDDDRLQCKARGLDLVTVPTGVSRVTSQPADDLPVVLRCLPVESWLTLLAFSAVPESRVVYYFEDKTHERSDAASTDQDVSRRRLPPPSRHGTPHTADSSFVQWPWSANCDGTVGAVTKAYCGLCALLELSPAQVQALHDCLGPLAFLSLATAAVRTWTVYTTPTDRAWMGGMERALRHHRRCHSDTRVTITVSGAGDVAEKEKTGQRTGGNAASSQQQQQHQQPDWILGRAPRYVYDTGDLHSATDEEGGSSTRAVGDADAAEYGLSHCALGTPWLQPWLSLAWHACQQLTEPDALYGALHQQEAAAGRQASLARHELGLADAFNQPRSAASHDAYERQDDAGMETSRHAANVLPLTLDLRVVTEFLELLESQQPHVPEQRVSLAHAVTFHGACPTADCEAAERSLSYAQQLVRTLDAVRALWLTGEAARPVRLRGLRSVLEYHCTRARVPASEVHRTSTRVTAGKGVHSDSPAAILAGEDTEDERCQLHQRFLKCAQQKVDAAVRDLVFAVGESRTEETRTEGTAEVARTREGGDTSPCGARPPEKAALQDARTRSLVQVRRRLFSLTAGDLTRLLTLLMESPPDTVPGTSSSSHRRRCSTRADTRACASAADGAVPHDQRVHLVLEVLEEYMQVASGDDLMEIAKTLLPELKSLESRLSLPVSTAPEGMPQKTAPVMRSGTVGEMTVDGEKDFVWSRAPAATSAQMALVRDLRRVLSSVAPLLAHDAERFTKRQLFELLVRLHEEALISAAAAKSVRLAITPECWHDEQESFRKEVLAAVSTTNTAAAAVAAASTAIPGHGPAQAASTGDVLSRLWENVAGPLRSTTGADASEQWVYFSEMELWRRAIRAATFVEHVGI